jgi:hypothetical protein
MMLGGKWFSKWLDQEDRAFVNGVSACMKRPNKVNGPFAIWGCNEKLACIDPGNKHSLNAKFTSIWSS